MCGGWSPCTGRGRGTSSPSAGTRAPGGRAAGACRARLAGDDEDLGAGCSGGRHGLLQALEQGLPPGEGGGFRRELRARRTRVGSAAAEQTGERPTESRRWRGPPRGGDGLRAQRLEQLDQRVSIHLVGVLGHPPGGAPSRCCQVANCSSPNESNRRSRRSKRDAHDRRRFPAIEDARQRPARSSRLGWQGQPDGAPPPVAPNHHEPLGVGQHPLDPSRACWWPRAAPPGWRPRSGDRTGQEVEIQRWWGRRRAAVEIGHLDPPGVGRVPTRPTTQNRSNRMTPGWMANGSTRRRCRDRAGLGRGLAPRLCRGGKSPVGGGGRSLISNATSGQRICHPSCPRVTRNRRSIPTRSRRAACGSDAAHPVGGAPQAPGRRAGYRPAYQRSPWWPQWSRGPDGTGHPDPVLEVARGLPRCRA